MRATVPMIGLFPDELPWLRMLIELLRDPDPSTPELARQALIYLKQSADQGLAAGPRSLSPSRR
jgi:hypothetical protein